MTKKQCCRALLMLLLSFILLAAGRYYGLRTGTPYHAPVLYELWSGETVELRVYDTVPGRPWELSAAQSGGTFQLNHTPGLTLWRDTASRAAGTTLPHSGYLILDLYDLGAIRAYLVRCGAFSMRDYQVEIKEGEGGFALTVRG